MKFKVLTILAVLLLASCASEPAPEPTTPAEPEMAAAPAADTGTDPLTGTWAGNWGPSAEHRNEVTLELAWDGTSLSGMVNPGANAIALDSASYDPETGAVTMTASAENFRGETVNYTIEGTLDGSTMTGSWVHDNQEGDFSITMQ